ncbi:MAG: pyruvate kinase [Nitrospiria bacterium]
MADLNRYKKRKAKIICTLGPATSSEEMISQLVQAGADVFRLNFSHGIHKEHAESIRRIRRISGKTGKPTAIIQDLQGPKIRIGRLEEETYRLRRNASFVIKKRSMTGTGSTVSTDYPALCDKVYRNDQILINDGQINLRVLKVQDGDIYCRVIEGGILQEHKGVNVPGRELGLKSLTPKDRDDLSFGLKQGVDFVAISMVRTARDIILVKRLIKKHGSNTPVIAKLEQVMAIEHLDDIMAAADGVMVARGDLGVEIPLERVPLLQKEIIRKANQAHIPVITATQMLESMIEQARPTRAEVSDVANAVFDGTDAVMLSAETASGKHPVKAVHMMRRTILAAEERPPDHFVPLNGEQLSLPEAVSNTACHLASKMDVKAIVTSTLSGNSALRLSKYRPRVPVLAFTPDPEVERRMSLLWGVIPRRMSMLKAMDDIFDKLVYEIKGGKLAKRGDLLVMVSQSPRPGRKHRVGAPTDLIKVHQVE